MDTKAISSPAKGGATPQKPSKTSDNPEQAVLPAKELGGRDGPDPTRFGDWEKNGRCIDF